MSLIFHCRILIFIVALIYCPAMFAADTASTQTPQQQADMQQKIRRLKEILSQVQKPSENKSAIPPLGSPQENLTLNEALQSQPGTTENTSYNDKTVATETAETPKVDPYEEAFGNVVNQLLPMTPEQIARLKGSFNEAQRAAATPVGTPPKPTSSSIIVNLAPQAAPPLVRLQAGYISSLVFVDSTAQPWPIAAYSLGDPTAFDIQWDKKGNTLLIQSKTFYKRSNLAVILKDLNTPVMLTLQPGQEAVDYRVDLRIPGLGPNATFNINGLPESTDPVLVDVLNGVPPPNSRSIKVSGGDCQAWLAADRTKLFLRTSLNIVSPAWRSVISSVDGTHAYEIQPTPRILASEKGTSKEKEDDKGAMGLITNSNGSSNFITLKLDLPG